MEQHPVPRNISGFQFHLIGDMTMRQFAYLAAGTVCGYFIFKAAPFSAVINIPLALFLGFAGFAFAFLPIQERPLDKWILAFIKSIMSPTQFLWYKNNAPLEIFTRTVAIRIQTAQPANQSQMHKETNEKLKAYLATMPVSIHETINAAEKRYIDKTLSLFQTTPVAASITPAVNTPPTPPPINSTPPNQIKPASEPTQEKAPLPAEKEVLPKLQEIADAPPAGIAGPVPLENHGVLKTRLSQMAAEKLALEKQLQLLQQQLTTINTPQTVKPQISADKKEPTIKVVSPKSAVSDMGVMNRDQTPNLIAGVIKDPQRKLLPNIILTIKDKSGLPVRALKTNKLGQFTTATPLPNGAYQLEVEDPLKRYVFDAAEISLSGKVFLPLEMVARGEKELTRERLTKELFGSTIT